MALDSLYQQVRADRLARYHAALASGVYRAYVWPWDTFPALYLILAMLVLPRLPPHIAKPGRIFLLTLIFGQGVWSVFRCRSIGMAGGYGIGLATDWGFITAAGLLWFNDLKKDFQRLEIRSGLAKTKTKSGTSEALAQSSAVSMPLQPIKRLQRGENNNTSASSAAEGTQMIWQSYPDDIWHCLDWLIDLLISFRGVNWNWRLVSFAPLDFAPKLPEDVTRSSANSRITTGYETPPTLDNVRQKAIRQLIMFYLAVDIAKTLVIHDPYYLGLVSIDSPHPLWLLQPYPALTRIVRLVLSLYSICVVLSLIVSALALRPGTVTCSRS
jgi:hypothetical protein